MGRLAARYATRDAPSSARAEQQLSAARSARSAVHVGPMRGIPRCGDSPASVVVEAVSTAWALAASPITSPRGTIRTLWAVGLSPHTRAIAAFASSHATLEKATISLGIAPTRAPSGLACTMPVGVASATDPAAAAASASACAVSESRSRATVVPRQIRTELGAGARLYATHATSLSRTTISSSLRSTDGGSEDATRHHTARATRSHVVFSPENSARSSRLRWWYAASARRTSSVRAGELSNAYSGRADE